MNSNDTQILFAKALRGEKLTEEEAAYVAKVAQENTEFRRRFEKIEEDMEEMVTSYKRGKKIAGAAALLIATNFFNDFFGHLLQ